MIDYKNKIDEARKLMSGIGTVPTREVSQYLNKVQEYTKREMNGIRRSILLQLRTGAEY